jgi:hypothetical protein
VVHNQHLLFNNFLSNNFLFNNFLFNNFLFNNFLVLYIQHNWRRFPANHCAFNHQLVVF